MCPERRIIAASPTEQHSFAHTAKTLVLLALNIHKSMGPDVTKAWTIKNVDVLTDVSQLIMILDELPILTFNYLKVST